MKRIRILIADDHGIVRKGLRLQLEQNEAFEIVAEAAEGREAVRLSEQLLPDVVIMDIAMPNLNGIQATAQLVKKNPQIAVIILSMYSDETYLTRTLAAGAEGYLLKENADQDLDGRADSRIRDRSHVLPWTDGEVRRDFERSVTLPRNRCVSAARSSGLMTSNSSETDSTPGSGSRCSLTWLSKLERRGQPATVSAIVTATLPSATRTSRTMSSSVTGRFSSGSITRPSASVICSREGCSIQRA